MVDPALQRLEEELARLRRLRDATVAILRHVESTRDEKLQAIERAFQGERDEDEEAEEAGDRERLS